MFFDTHAHYDDERYDEDRHEFLEEMHRGNVSMIMNCGCDRTSSEESMALAERYDFVYAAVGWHPHEASAFDEAAADLIRKWVRHDKVKAIGEIGLDYHYDFSPREVQRKVFIRQMELAQELDMPVIIHDREAHGECLDIIAQFPDVRGEFHCYSGSAEMAHTLIDRGWYLGFGGSVTFKNARKALETIEVTPLELILLETDAPYLAPTPHRGERNDSRYLEYVARVIADIKKIPVQQVAEIAAENGKRFFGIA